MPLKEKGGRKENVAGLVPSSQAQREGWHAPDFRAPGIPSVPPTQMDVLRNLDVKYP